MEALLRLFGNICIFKKGPQDVPASINFLLILLLVNFIIENLLGVLFYSLALSVFQSLASISVLFLFTWICLILFQYKNRFIQTVTAFAGISLFINIFFLVPLVVMWKMGVLVDNSFALINLLLLVWTLSIYAHVYKNALNVSFFLGLALSITYFITYTTLSNYIIGAS